MKHSILVYTYIFFMCISLTQTACTKDRVPVPIVDTACPDTISFASNILPVVQDKCVSCHGSGAGTLPTFSVYSDISSHAEQILNALKGTPQLMPQGGHALPDSTIQQFDCWIKQGKLNN